MEGLGLDIKLFIAQLINFILFFIIFKKYLYPPFIAYLKKQKNDEEEKEKLLKDLQNQKDKLDKERQHVLEEARAQTIIILKDAEKSAMATKEDIIAKAKKEADTVKQSIKKELEQERTQLYKEVKKHIIVSSRNLVTSVLSDFVDKKTQKQLVLQIAKKLQDK